MSSRGGGGGGGGGGSGGLAEGSRVWIPDNAKQTIQSIREITGKQHSDEEIYATLKECFMDPNETAQKLLFMDTFHDVKRKCDKKKETPGTQGRGGRGSRGNYNSISGRDAGSGRNAFPRRENGFNRNADKVKNNAPPRRTRSPTSIPNGTGSLPNGSSAHGRGPQLSIGNSTSETKDGLPVNKPTTVGESPAPIHAQSFSSLLKGQEKSALNLNSSSTSTISPAAPVVSSSASSDPVSTPIVSGPADAMDAIKPEVAHQQVAAEINHNKRVPRDIDVPEIEKTVSVVQISMHGKEEPDKSKVAEQVKQPKAVEQVVTSEVATVADKANTQLVADSNVRNGQHVTFPTHFQVSEALKNGLTFGSFDASFGQVSEHSNVTSLEINSASPVETSQGGDEAAGEPASRGLGIFPAEEGDDADQQAPPELDEVPESDGNESSGADMNVVQSNQEMHMYTDYNQTAFQNVPGYGVGFMPASLTNFAQFDGPEAQSHDVSRLTNFVGGNHPVPSGSSTPPIQSTVGAAPQTVHLFRQPFPPNYFPYTPYIPPFYMHPMHQFINPAGIPQQPSTGNVYMPPGATPPGVRFPPSQFKPGTNAGNPAHLAIPSGYGQLTSPPIGFNLPVPSVTSGSSSSKEDIAAMQSNENHIYTTGQPNEGSALWIPAPELSNMQMNSYYNLPLHSQQVPYSPAQAGHSAFGGLYQTPPQTMVAPSNVNPLLQQSQPMAAAIGTVGPPSGPYQQQPQLAQVNWKSNY